MHERCAGLDVHQKTVVVCVLTGAAGSEAKQEKRTFTTVTSDLQKLGDWLGESEVTQVAMESSGVYWKPVWAVLEGQFDLTLANAAHIKNVPGRKTDQKDAEWIAELLRHGLIEKSFVPPVAVQDLRELTRYRAQVTGERSSVGNRIRKLLEGANIKLGFPGSACWMRWWRAKAMPRGWRIWRWDSCERNKRSWKSHWMAAFASIIGGCCGCSWPTGGSWIV
jgi:transposase